MIIAHRIAYSVARDTAVVNIVEGPVHILTLRLDVMAATQCRYIAFIHFASLRARDTMPGNAQISTPAGVILNVKVKGVVVGQLLKALEGPQSQSGDPIDRQCA